MGSFRGTVTSLLGINPDVLSEDEKDVLLEDAKSQLKKSLNIKDMVIKAQAREQARLQKENAKLEQELANAAQERGNVTKIR